MKHAGRGTMMTPANRSYTRQQPEPVDEQNENENRGEKPKRFFHQIAANYALEKIVETLYQPFPKILDATGQWRDSSGRGLRKNDDPRSDNPRHQHRVCDRKLPDLNDRGRFQ